MAGRLMEKHHAMLASSNNQLVSLSLGASSSESMRPGLSFFVGTSLVVAIILALTAGFSFCYHWARMKRDEEEEGGGGGGGGGGEGAAAAIAAASSAYASNPRVVELHIDIATTASSPVAGCKPACGMHLQDKQCRCCPPVVYMPGDDHLPRFIAWPCPHVPSYLDDTC